MLLAVRTILGAPFFYVGLALMAVGLLICGEDEVVDEEGDPRFGQP